MCIIVITLKYRINSISIFHISRLHVESGYNSSVSILYYYNYSDQLIYDQTFPRLYVPDHWNTRPAVFHLH